MRAVEVPENDLIPEADRVEGAPHPRETETLIGHPEAEQAFLDAFNSGRLHHGWLISGPQGVGKATFAWQIAKFLLSQPLEDDGGLFGAPPPPTTMRVSPEDPVAQQVVALSEPGLFLLRRGWNDKTKKLKSMITVDEVRKLHGFFGMSAVDGRRRVVIVDAADDMNVQAANAILKMLEEPPARTTILLVSHQPSRLLPTIRSRCRELRLRPLDAGNMTAALSQAGAEPEDNAAALATLSGGSVGGAMRLIRLDGLKLYEQLISLMDTMPRLDQPQAIKLADHLAARGNDAKLELFETLLDLAIARMARQGSLGVPAPTPATGHETQVFAKLAPDAWAARKWADQAQDILARFRHGRAVNLDPSALILDTLFHMNRTAAGGA